MDEKALSDRFTVIAIAIIAYAGANVSHEIIGHCGSAALLGSKCSYISTTDIRLATQLPAWQFRIDAFAGSGANWVVGLMSLGLLRAWRDSSTAWRYFLWLSMCVNLFLPSTYLLVSPVIMFGDWYSMVYDLPHSLVWRGALSAAGAVACWLSFRLCRAELRRLIGFRGDAARSIAWGLVVPAYVAGGATAVLAAMFSPLPAKWAQLVAGGTFGVTVWLLLLPPGMKGAPTTAQHPFKVPRSVGWIAAGALVAFVFIGVLGRGFPV